MRLTAILRRGADSVPALFRPWKCLECGTHHEGPHQKCSFCPDPPAQLHSKPIVVSVPHSAVATTRQAIADRVTKLQIAAGKARLAARYVDAQLFALEVDRLLSVLDSLGGEATA